MARAYPSMMGSRLRRIRRAHGASLRALADTVRTSASYLSQVESGQRALDRHSMLLALADALGTMPEAFTMLPVPAPGNGGVDQATEAIRQAVLGVHYRRPGGQVVALDTLRARTAATVHAQRSGRRTGEVGTDIAALIRDLHSSIEDSTDPGGLLELAVQVHTQAALEWLRVAGAPVGLRLQLANLAHRAARDLATPAALGVASCGGVPAMISAGLVELARGELEAIDIPATGSESTRLAGLITMCRALVAAVESRPADAAALFTEAGQLAEHAGAGDALGTRFNSATVTLWQMSGLLELGDYKQAARAGAGLRPLDPLDPLEQADYWVTYARALARRPGHRDDAGLALRRAEEICPYRLYRDPFGRDLLAELLNRSPNGGGDQDLRALAQRAALVSA